MQLRPSRVGPLACALALTCGCVTRRVDAPANLDAALPLQLERERAWRVVRAGELVGVIVLFEAPGPGNEASKQLYSVRNALQQELGTIDGLGRAWRFEPHSREARWVATGTLVEGVRAILELDAQAELVAVESARRDELSRAR